MVLSEMRHLVRDVLVWATWTLLQGTPFHNKSYGELRRLTLRDVVGKLGIILVALSGLIWAFMFMPSGWHSIYFVSFLIFGGAGVFLILSTYTVTWLLDRQMTYL